MEAFLVAALEVEKVLGELGETSVDLLMEE
jgi:hypothetical protein